MATILSASDWTTDVGTWTVLTKLKYGQGYDFTPGAAWPTPDREVWGTLKAFSKVTVRQVMVVELDDGRQVVALFVDAGVKGLPQSGWICGGEGGTAYAAPGDAKGVALPKSVPAYVGTSEGGDTAQTAGLLLLAAAAGLALWRAMRKK